MQLAGLPALSSVSLLDSSCPTQFLNTLGNRLTALHLDRAYRQVQAGTHTPAPAWQATLEHVARCTALQALAIPCVTSEELGTVAPALQQLRRLHLNGPCEDVDGDAVVERLLGLPHLTSLKWDDITKHKLRRSHASSPCRWKELSLPYVNPRQLARLPLHSLTSPVSWRHVALDHRTSVAEVQAAADNVARRCPAGGVWWDTGDNWWGAVAFNRPPDDAEPFAQGAGEGDTPVALLRALRPLLAAPGLARLWVYNLAWDVELVKALGEAVPRTCTALDLTVGAADLPACVQLAQSLPWLDEVCLCALAIPSPHAVTAYAAAATCAAGLLFADGRPRLRRVRVSSCCISLRLGGARQGRWKVKEVQRFTSMSR